ncbi:hypothetical protein HDU83_007841 [Entophlyctis luteolus]|nr:hypothetical protein HDU83_007841 [Entophlyctis luteolus]
MPNSAADQTLSQTIEYALYQDALGVFFACCLAYLLLVFALRYRNYFLISRMPSPTTVTEAHYITSIGLATDFPFLYRTALEFGLFKTYGIPSIAKLLVATKQLTHHTCRRYDDTDLIVNHFYESPESPAGLLAIQRLNHLHGKYNIKNDDFLYTLAIFIVEPIRWIEKYGFRKLHQNEIHAQFIIFQDMGRKMNIADVFDSYNSAAKFIDEYERIYVSAFCEESRILADATSELFLSIVPTFMHPTSRLAIWAVCPPKLRTVMGFPHPSHFVEMIVEGTLWIVFAVFQRFLMLPRTKPLRRTTDWEKVCPIMHRNSMDPASAIGVLMKKQYTIFENAYPNGYFIERLGPENFADDGGLGKLGG